MKFTKILVITLILLCLGSLEGKRTKKSRKSADDKSGPAVLIRNAEGKVSTSAQNMYFDIPGRDFAFYVDHHEKDKFSKVLPELGIKLDIKEKLADYKVKLMGLYSRQVAGDSAISIVTEVADFFSHGFLHMFNLDQKFMDKAGRIHHEFIAFCAEREGEKKSRYFVIDRAAKQAEKETERIKEALQTLVRIIYTGTDDDICNKDSKQWPEIKNPSFLLVTRAKAVIDPTTAKSLKDIIDASIHYAQKYRDYNPFVQNCQHYATGIFNTVTTAKLEYTNEKEMEVSHMKHIMDLTNLFDPDFDPNKPQKDAEKVIKLRRTISKFGNKLKRKERFFNALNRPTNLS